MKISFTKTLSKSKRAGKAAVPKAVSAPVVIRDPLPLPGNLLPRLMALRRWYKVVGVSTGLSRLVAAISLLLLVQGASDWWFDLPWLARAGFLLADIVIVVVIYRRHLKAVLHRKLDLPETALLVEKKWPHLQQSVIAAVQLTEGRDYSTRGSTQLIEVMLEQARARTEGLNFIDVVPTHALRRWLISGGAAALVAVFVAVAAWPASLPLLERIFLFNVPLPTKTIVISITRDLVIPIGNDVEISALAQGIIPAQGRVVVTYAEGAPQEFSVNADPQKPATFRSQCITCRPPLNTASSSTTVTALSSRWMPRFHLPSLVWSASRYSPVTLAPPRARSSRPNCRCWWAAISTSRRPQPTG